MNRELHRVITVREIHGELRKAEETIRRWDSNPLIPEFWQAGDYISHILPYGICASTTIDLYLAVNGLS